MSDKPTNITESVTVEQASAQMCGLCFEGRLPARRDEDGWYHDNGFRRFDCYASRLRDIGEMRDEAQGESILNRNALKRAQAEMEALREQFECAKSAAHDFEQEVNRLRVDVDRHRDEVRCAVGRGEEFRQEADAASADIRAMLAITRGETALWRTDGPVTEFLAALYERDCRMLAGMVRREEAAETASDTDDLPDCRYSCTGGCKNCSPGAARDAAAAAIRALPDFKPDSAVYGVTPKPPEWCARCCPPHGDGKGAIFDHLYGKDGMAPCPCCNNPPSPPCTCGYDHVNNDEHEPWCGGPKPTPDGGA